MGFPIVEIRMPEYDGTEAKLERWLVPSDAFVNWDKPIADVLVDGSKYQLVCNMPVGLEEISVEPGSKLKPNQLVARALAEGHQIPRSGVFTRLESVD